MRSPFRRAPAALALAAGIALSGCTAATDAAESSDSTGELSAAQQDCVDGVTPQVETASAEVPLVGPSAPLDLAALSGKTIWFITVTMNQFSSDMLAGVQEAADAAGLEVVSYDGQGQTNRYSEGISQAVAQDAAGIILIGIDPAVVSAELAAAEAAGIPVQNTLNGDPGDTVPDGTYGNLTSDFSADGATAVDWALADGGCDVDMAVVYSSAIGVWDKMATAAEAEMTSACPDCGVTLINVDLANLATDLGSQLQTALQRDPDIDYVYVVWDSGVPLVTPVLSTAGSSATIFSRDGLDGNIANVLDGTQAMTLGTPPTGWLGWLSMDDLARDMTSADSQEYVIPTRLIDEGTVGDGSTEAIWPDYADYQSAFTDAWSGS